uniref:Gamma-glutamylaminecyclotransferase n=1 Tax=Cyprinus carpio TaxID=7962 RepID=A0A8C2HNS3_CYPCA
EKGFRIIQTSLIINGLCTVVHMHHVFVYGTLKKGQPNHFKMLDSANAQAKCLARARTVERYPLVIATNDNITFLLNVPGMGQHVHGEIYCVYQRTTVQVEVEVQGGDGEGENTLKPGSIVKVFVYSKNKTEWLQKPTYESAIS